MQRTPGIYSKSIRRNCVPMNAKDTEHHISMVSESRSMHQLGQNCHGFVSQEKKIKHF